MPAFMLPKPMSVDDALERLRGGLKDPRVISIERGKKDTIRVLTSWLKFDIAIDPTRGKVKITSGWNPSKMFVVIISVLLFILPMFLISIFKMGEQMQIPKEIEKVLS